MRLASCPQRRSWGAWTQQMQTIQPRRRPLVAARVGQRPSRPLQHTSALLLIPPLGDSFCPEVFLQSLTMLINVPLCHLDCTV